MSTVRMFFNLGVASLCFGTAASGFALHFGPWATGLILALGVFNFGSVLENLSHTRHD